MFLRKLGRVRWSVAGTLSASALVLVVGFQNCGPQLPQEVDQASTGRLLPSRTSGTSNTGQNSFFPSDGDAYNSSNSSTGGSTTNTTTGGTSSGGSTTGGSTTTTTQITEQQREFVRTLYFSLLNRAPASNEVEAWAGTLASGSKTATKIREEFVQGGEFINSGISSREFVNKIYWILLGRAPEQQGRQANEGALANGTPRATIVQQFLQSSEYSSKSASFAGVTRPTDSNSEYVRLLYVNILGRNPSAEENNAWTNYLSGGGSRAILKETFLKSSEFLNRSISGQDFATILYNQVLNRAPEPGAADAWAAEMGSRGLARSTAVGQFLNSEEYLSVVRY